MLLVSAVPGFVSGGSHLERARMELDVTGPINNHPIHGDRDEVNGKG